MTINVIPWRIGDSSLYAVVRDSHCLADQFLDVLELHDVRHAMHLAGFIAMITREPFIRPGFLRDELPERGIYAMYQHGTVRRTYNPARLLCGYVGTGNRILLVGSGFVKQKTEPLQENRAAYAEANMLADIIDVLNTRITTGEIEVVGSRLDPMYHDSLNLYL